MYSISEVIKHGFTKLSRGTDYLTKSQIPGMRNPFWAAYQESPCNTQDTCQGLKIMSWPLKTPCILNTQTRSPEQYMTYSPPLWGIACTVHEVTIQVFKGGKHAIVLPSCNTYETQVSEWTHNGVILTQFLVSDYTKSWRLNHHLAFTSIPDWRHQIYLVIHIHYIFPSIPSTLFCYDIWSIGQKTKIYNSLRQ